MGADAAPPARSSLVSAKAREGERLRAGVLPVHITEKGGTMNRHQFNQSLYYCLRFARGLVALGVLLVASKAAVADVTFLGVDKQAKLTNGGTTAIVTGLVACDAGQIYNVGAVVAQATTGLGTLVPVGDFPQYPACSGSNETFAVPVQALAGAFNTGPADARVSAIATGTPTGSQTQQVDVKIEL